MASLTNKERKILQLLKDGSLVREVAEKLDVSSRTIETHLYHVHKKLGSRNIREALLMFDKQQSEG